jgi:hypothetical protein
MPMPQEVALGLGAIARHGGPYPLLAVSGVIGPVNRSVPLRRRSPRRNPNSLILRGRSSASSGLCRRATPGELSAMPTVQRP